MNKIKFYARLAGQSLVKNRKFYLPYIICCIAISAMFYILTYLAGNDGLNHLRGTVYVQIVMGMGCFVIATFGGTILFYANSFLIKRRKKELGLYNVLGMQKRNIACAMLWETMYTAIISIAGGLAVGILFSKLVLLLLCQILKIEIYFGFEISYGGIVSTIIIFMIIFFLNLLTNLRYVMKAQPVEMLRAGNQAEREPKSKWPLSIIGILCLGGGYYLGVTAPAPELFVFFLAVDLVIVGTYCLFTSASIIILKFLRRNKKYYYKTEHFTSVSGMLHRMKKNATGLASICILSTMVLVTVSCTVCLYIGSDDYLQQRFPNDIQVELGNTDEATVEQMKESILETGANENVIINSMIVTKRLDFSIKDINEDMSDLDRYGRFEKDDPKCILLQVIPEEIYEATTGSAIELHNGEIMTQVLRSNVKIPEKMSIIGNVYTTSSIDNFPLTGEVTNYATRLVGVVVTNEDYYSLYDALRIREQQMIDEGIEANPSSLTTMIGFDVECTDEAELAFTSLLMEKLSMMENCTYEQLSTDCRANNVDAYNALYGGFFFLGIFLGMMFLMATVLIIYYKQVSEGYEDTERFRIMQRVGMSQKEVKSSIHSQILTVFFLPLIVAGVHIVFAFPILMKILTNFSLYNTELLIICCVVTYVIFAATYVLIYTTTARSYYQIVKA